MKSSYRVSKWKQKVKMTPQPCGHPQKGPQRTRPTSHTAQQCCVHFPTVNCVMPNQCECWAPNRPCTGSCTLTIFCNTYGQNPLTWYAAVWYNSNAHNKREKIPTKKSPKYACISTDLLSGSPPNHLPGRRYVLLPNRLKCGRVWNLCSGHRRCRSSEFLFWSIITL